MKNILLHGSTTSTNFGDYLFADMVYDYVKRNMSNANVNYVRQSPFFSKYLNIKDKELKVGEIDSLVYIPGHYFIVKEDEGTREKLWRLKEFIYHGYRAAVLGKKIAILDIGAGPFRNSILSRPIRYICNKAQLLTVRDHGSKQHLIDIGVTNKIIVTSDLVFSLDKERIKEPESEFTDKLNEKMPNKKYIFVHYNNNKEAMKKFALGIKDFIQNNPNYGLIVGADSIVSNDDELYNEFKETVESDNLIYHKYEDPWELCGVLDMCEMVITTKLHVGIVSLRLEKSVISFPIHQEKTKRLYNQINEGDRCKPLNSTEPQIISNMVEQYHNVKIPLNVRIYNAANKNWELLEKFLEL